MRRLCLALALALLTAAPAAAQDLTFFRSPSGNIHCMIATGDWATVRCDIMELQPTYRSPPAGCDLDWGHSFEVGLTDRQGQLACVGDTVAMPDSAVLGYGRSVTLAGFTCVSEKTGMTCMNPAGHGFTIAKAKQKLF